MALFDFNENRLIDGLYTFFASSKAAFGAVFISLCTVWYNKLDYIAHACPYAVFSALCSPFLTPTITIASSKSQNCAPMFILYINGTTNIGFDTASDSCLGTIRMYIVSNDVFWNDILYFIPCIT